MKRTRHTVLFHEVTADGDRSAEPVMHEVLMTHQDDLNAEKRSRGFGIKPQNEPMAFHTLAIFCALVREGHYAGDFLSFKNRDCVDFDTEQVDVDPTRPSRTIDSPSPSDSTGPESTGSQPTTS